MCMALYRVLYMVLMQVLCRVIYNGLYVDLCRALYRGLCRGYIRVMHGVSVWGCTQGLHTVFYREPCMV